MDRSLVRAYPTKTPRKSVPFRNRPRDPRGERHQALRESGDEVDASVI
jgi:hypothetical protein